MEEDMSSIVSNGGATGTVEASDSTGSKSSLVVPPSGKRARHGGCRVSSSTRFKGVVPQLNGHWGAQIYANHQRIWLGTFKSEREAAMAYDSAAIRIRNGDSHRNFPRTDATLEEPTFQARHTTDQLLNTIKDGSYQSKFNEFLRARFENAAAGTGLELSTRALTERGGLAFKHLFEKELTPSDVGKLNRLVIPKKYAVKHFPRIADRAGNDDILLVFHDTSMRAWKFRYCYWKSSQSFVFTRGWNRFVKDKQLRENDTVAFYSCECSQPGNEEPQPPPRTVFVIDVIGVEGARNNTTNSVVEDCVGLNLEMNLKVDDEETVEIKANKQVCETGKSGFRLFGVQISS